MNGFTPDQQVIIITAVIAALTSSGVMSLIMYFIQRHDKKKDADEAKKSAQTKMLIGLGHDRIIQRTDWFVRRGCITLKEKRNLKYLWDPYSELGGNGDCEIGIKAVELLPVVSDEEAEQKDSELRRKEYLYENEQ